MTRFLKTTFPCVDCGTLGVRVKLLAHAKFARCPLCQERGRALNRVNLAWHLSGQDAKKANSLDPSARPYDFAGQWLRIEGTRIDALGLWTEALPLLERGERLKAARRISDLLGQQMRVLERIREHVLPLAADQAQEDFGLRLLEGADPIPAEQIEPRPAPRLSLVPKEGA